MITLNVKEVYARAREAYANEELQAQQPEKDRVSYCSYQGPCAIGVSVPFELRHDFDYVLYSDGTLSDFPGNSIHGLIEEKRVVTDDEKALSHLQLAHDRWVSYKDNGFTAEQAEANFVEQLGKY
jgi:hypothetical protein